MAEAATRAGEMDDLDAYASPNAQISGQFQKPEEKNKGKSQLDRQEEYIFELMERRLLRGAAGFNNGKKVDKILCEWREINTGNIVVNSFRLDSPTWNDKSPELQSPILTFFDNIGMPIPKDPEMVKRQGFWGSKFILTMRIRARVLPGKDGNGEVVPGKYKLDLGTVRQYKRS